jgi:hypothetical protein
MVLLPSKITVLQLGLTFTAVVKPFPDLGVQGDAAVGMPLLPSIFFGGAIKL